MEAGLDELKEDVVERSMWPCVTCTWKNKVKNKMKAVLKVPAAN